MKYKGKRPGIKKPIVEGIVGRRKVADPSLRRRIGDFVNSEQLIDRLRKPHWYRKRVVTDSGEVLRDVDHPLSEHRDRGSAKPKKG